MLGHTDHQDSFWIISLGAHFLDYLFGLIFLLAVANSAIKVANESTRYHVTRLGRNFRLAGPGIIFLIPVVDRSIKLKLGTSGEMTSATTACFNAQVVPVQGGNALGIGTRVVISRFGVSDIWVRRS